MKISKTFEAVQPGKKRKGIILEVELGPNAKARVQDIMIIPTTPTIPIPLYQHPDGTITLATDRRIENENRSYEAFRLRTARVRSWSKGCSLQVAVGRVLLGYINPTDEEIAEEWLDRVIEELNVLVPEAVKKLMEKTSFVAKPARTEVVEKEVAGVDYTPRRSERSFR